MADVPLGATPDDYGVTEADLIDVKTRMVVNDAGEVEAVEVRTLSAELIAELNRMRADLDKMPLAVRKQLTPAEFYTSSLAGDEKRGIGVYKLVARVALPWCSIALSSVAAERVFAQTRLMEQTNRLQRKPSTWLNELMCVANEWKIEKHFEATVATIPSDIGKI